MDTLIRPQCGNTQRLVMPDADVSPAYFKSLSDEDLLSQIATLRRPAQMLSRVHREWLADLEREANDRRLTIPES